MRVWKFHGLCASRFITIIIIIIIIIISIIVIIIVKMSQSHQC